MSLDHIVAKIVKCGHKIEIYTYNQPIPVGFEKTVAKAEDTVDPEEREQHKRLDNLYRARQTVRRLIWCNITKYTKMITLTYADAEFDIKRVRRNLCDFLKKMKRRGYVLPYLYVLEHQKGRGDREGNEGSLHIHLIAFSDRFIPTDVLHECWTYGTNVDIHTLKDIRDLGAYVCKYITKETVAEFGGHCYECSQGLKRPEIENVYAEGYTDTCNDPQGLSRILSQVRPTYTSRVNYDTVFRSIGKSDMRHLELTYIQAYIRKDTTLTDFVRGETGEI